MSFAALPFSSPLRPEPYPAPAWRRRSVDLLTSLVAPACAAVLVLRYIFPSRLEGAQGGVIGALASAGSKYPLFGAVLLFLVFAEVLRYWRTRLSDQVGVIGPNAAMMNRRAGSRLVLSLGLAAVAAFVLRSSVAATFTVVGPSMLPTLEMGDRLLVNRLAYGIQVPLTKIKLRTRVPARGDLVVFRATGQTGADGPQSIVKRVIGVPGDEVAFQGGAPVVNGWRVPGCDAGPFVGTTGRLTVKGRLTVEHFAGHSYLTVRKPLDYDYPTYIVKPGEVYVLGDDRGISSDSRLWNEGRGGGVPIDHLEGRVSRVLLGALPDGRLDLSRWMQGHSDLQVRLPEASMKQTEERIAFCLKTRPLNSLPPPPRRGSGIRIF